MLEYEPHAFHIVFGISPVTHARKIAEIQFVLLALGYTCCGKGDFAGDERLATSLGLVVEQNSRAAEHAVCFTILFHYPKAIQLGHSIRAVGVEWRVFILRHFFHLSIQFGCGSLIYAACLSEAAEADGLKDTQHSDSVDIRCELRTVERYLHMALRREVVNLVGTNLVHHLHHRHRVAEVRIMQMEIPVTLKMGYSFAEIYRRTAYSAVHIVAFIN